MINKARCYNLQAINELRKVPLLISKNVNCLSLKTSLGNQINLEKLETIIHSYSDIFSKY